MKVTSGLPARGPQAWSALAIRLLPVPVSPWIRTWPSAWETSRIVSRRASTAGLLPMNRLSRTVPSDSSRRSARDSSVRSRAASALWQSSARISGSKGFSTKSKAPMRIASTAIGTSPCPVIRITGMPGSTDWSLRRSAMPSMPGMRMSLTTTPGKSELSSLSAGSAASKQTGSRSLSFSHCETEARMSASSSMIATVGLSAIAFHSAACSVSPLTGRMSSKTAPPSGALRATRRPPISAAKPAEIARPSPSPSPGFLVV